MSRLAPALAALLLAAPALATPTPSFKVPTVLNAPLKTVNGIGDLKGKVVVLEFWATWCHPCVAGIPRTNRLIDSLKGEPVVFLSVTDEAPEVVEGFMKTHEMKAWVGVDPDGASFKAFKVTGRPTAFLIGKDGNMLAKVWPDMLREKDLRKALAGTYAERPIAADEPPPERATMDDDFPGKTLIELRVSVGGNPKWRMSGDGSRKEAWGMNFQATVAHALGVQYEQVIVDSAPVKDFNFRLSVPDGRAEAGQELIRSALETAFGVKIGLETRDTAALALVPLKTHGGPSMKAAAPGTESVILSMGMGQVLGTVTMADAAKALWMNLGVPVVDETGWGGAYDLDLQWKDKDDADRDRALAALGLKLVPVRRPLQFWVVKAAAKP